MIGVVFGTYNRLPHLQRAIASVRRATTKHDVMIYVVDGGSTDGSKEWLRKEQAEWLDRPHNSRGPGALHLQFQEGSLTGAVKAFNLGFSAACSAGCEYIFHFNDDAEIVTPGAFDQAVDILQKNPKVGEVAFEFDLRGPWQHESVNGKIYGNFGMIRREAGMAVAKAQGDAAGLAWWNPIYRTYGADCEFGMWLWKLGWIVYPGVGLRVHDCNAQDDLRRMNEDWNPSRRDSILFWERARTVLA
jgi:GT2 family glycosyltransferase